MQEEKKIQTFENRLNKVLERLKSLPSDLQSDEVSVPLYLHKNFLVRKIFTKRFMSAYNMISFGNKSVLDYGCGSGIFLESLSYEIREGIGVDLNIEIAKKIVKSKNVTLTQITSQSEITKFSNVDVITSFDVLEHVIDLSSLISTFTKILSPGGIIVISGPTENFVYSIARKVAQLGIKGNLKGKDEHLRDIFEIKNRILEEGFKVHKDVNLWNLFRVISFKMEN